jgi:hypothetical protein
MARIAREIWRQGVHRGHRSQGYVPKISPDLVAEKVLEAPMAGQDEVLVDRITERAKAALSGPASQLAFDRLRG